MAQFLIGNYPSPTTAVSAAVATGTNIKTMLQVKPSATLAMRILRWGFSTTAPASTATLVVELIETDVAATVTAHVAAGLVKYDALAQLCGDPTTNLIPVGTTSTGYTASGEGTITATRLLAGPQTIVIPTTGGAQFEEMFPLGEQPSLTISLFTRIRMHSTVDVNARCWMLVEL